MLEKALQKIGRDDIVQQCIFNVELVTDDMERAVAKVQLDQSGFDNLREELGPSRDATLRRNASLNPSYDEQDMMKVFTLGFYICINNNSTYCCYLNLIFLASLYNTRLLY